jgi:hypothetical protein
MIWNNYIGTDFLISKHICENIIEIGENKIKNNFGHKTKSNGRNDIAINLSNFGNYTKSENFIYVNNAIKKSLEEFCDLFLPEIHLSKYTYREHKFQKSENDGGFYKWHWESMGKDSNRAFVWMLYLNTVEKGGKTEFYKTKNDIISIKPEIGKFVFWPAGETHTHRAAPDLQETKYILTGWVNRP